MAAHYLGAAVRAPGHPMWQVDGGFLPTGTEVVRWLQEAEWPVSSLLRLCLSGVCKRMLMDPCPSTSPVWEDYGSPSHRSRHQRLLKLSTPSALAVPGHCLGLDCTEAFDFIGS